MNKIDEKIELIPPLPETVTNINRIANNPDTSVKELAKEIKKDPIASASILKEANSPLYGFKNIDTIDKAVAMFGKATARGIAINELARDALTIDLSPYQMTEKEFQDIAQKRSFLMMKWYSRVDFSLLSTLAITGLIGNIGQVVIADVIKSLKKVDEFQKILIEKGVDEAEKTIVGATTIEVTSSILKHWKLDDKIVKSIKYSNSFNEIDENEEIEELKSLAIANHIVYKIVDLLGKNNMLCVSEDIDLLMQENGLKLKLLENAIKFIA